MKKVCIVTAARSEYGLLRWTIDAVHHDPELELQLVVTGAHLLEEQGLTYNEIVADGYPIAYKADMHLKTKRKYEIAESMGNCSIAMAQAFSQLQPDLLVVLGDRYELLPICSVALVMSIPIAHISGGDITIGAIDNEVRNAVTMMSSLHFPGVQSSADNIARMRNSANNVFNVGEPGLENFYRLNLWSREHLADNIGIPTDNKWVLVTIHPETQQTLGYNLELAMNVIEMLINKEGLSIVITKANADFGGSQINDYFEVIADLNNKKVKLYPSLGQLRYLSFMRECYAVVGNSSSGIIEAPCLAKPVINIGDRQRGRFLCANVQHVKNNFEDIENAWNTIEKAQKCEPIFYYGDGNTSSKILACIKDFLYGKNSDRWRV